MNDVTTVSPPEPPKAPPPAGGYAAGPPPVPPKGSGGGGATAGIVLIVLGTLFLLGRFAPVYAWWTLWPLIIVVAGLVQAFTPGKDGWSVTKMFDGFVTVAFGGVFLAITAGYVSWSVWGRIVTFWPVLLIALGLEILGKALRASWPKVLGSLAIIGALAFSVATVDSRASGPVTFFGSRTGGTAYALDAPVNGVRAARLTLDAGVARVRMARGVDLVNLDGRSPFGEPRLEVDRASTPAEVTVKLDDGDQVMMWPGDYSADFDVLLSDSVLWDLRINTGVSDLKADLAGVPVATLDLRPGVANCDVRLGAVPQGLDEARADVKAGVSTVKLSIPAGSEARVEIASGLSGNTVRGEFESRGSGVWETSGYASARTAGDPVWVIVVKSGIGSITVDTY